MDAMIVLDEAQPGLSVELQSAIEREQLGSRTEHTYQQWIAQYLAFNGFLDPANLSETNVREFLKHIIRNLSPSRARLNQARQALVFFYECVLKRPLQPAALEFNPA